MSQNPITVDLTTAKFDATGYQYLASLANYSSNNFSGLEDKKQDANALGKLPSIDKQVD